MSPILVVSVILAYFLLLVVISRWTSRGASTNTFFTGDRQSHWFLVAFGMIGTSLSGITFISVPGAVWNSGMGYFQVVLGYILGYLVIAKVLMPIYYRMNVVSIYEYLLDRFGIVSHKTGAAIFILSRTLGSAMRLYLATNVLQYFLFDPLNIPYWVTALVSITLIWVYTNKGGIKTIVITDTIQTFFLIASVILCGIIILNQLDLSIPELYERIGQTEHDGKSIRQFFFWDDPLSKSYFPKQFFGGMFLAIVMTGLDQDLMQKNLTCRNLKEAQKNVYTFTSILVVVNLIFLILGGALYVYAQEKGIELPRLTDGSINTDSVFPSLAFDDFGVVAGIFFLLGIIAASYSSSDSALAALTTGFCIDFLRFKERSDEKEKARLKRITHLGFSLIFLIIVIVTHSLQASSLITLILQLAAYTYGPLLGLFAFGIFTKRKLKDQLVPIICVLIPTLCYLLSQYSSTLLFGYQFSYEILILNGLLTFIGLWIISEKSTS
ncbi:MAG: sodium:solute symporter [Bacteroidetes bacterium]|nr:MAG: sodium:solute symporter [Bacteroidota bacterium]